MSNDVMGRNEAQYAFDEWSSKHDHYSNEYLNMGGDGFFFAGYQSALQSAAVLALIAEVLALRDLASSQVYELMGVVVDVEEGNGFDDTCLNTIKRVMGELAGAK